MATAAHGAESPSNVARAPGAKCLHPGGVGKGNFFCHVFICLFLN